MTVNEIVKKYLNDNGYIGLYNEEDECTCDVDDLEHCDGMLSYICKARHKPKRDSEDHDPK